MPEKGVFWVKLAAANITPDKIPLDYLSKLLATIHKMLASIKTFGQDEQGRQVIIEVNFGLTTVEQTGSTSLALKPDRYVEGYQKFSGVVNQLNRRSYDEPEYQYARELQRLAKDLNTPIEFYDDHSSEPLSIVSPYEVDAHMPPPIMGTTTLYGVVVRVGGQEPRLMLRLEGGVTRYLTVSEPMAVELGRRLYNEVGLTGMAHWNPLTWELLDFRPDKLLDYDPKPYTDAFEELAKASEKSAWIEIDDVTGYIADLRGGDKHSC